jgi:hypothetical protein
LVRLWRSKGNVRQAWKLLAPVDNSLTEGLDTHDFKEADVLFTELAS